MFKRKRKQIPSVPKGIVPKETISKETNDVESFLWWPNDSGSYKRTKMEDDDIAVQAVLHGERTTSNKKFFKEVKKMRKYPQTVEFTMPRGTKLEKWQRERLDKMCKTMVANNFKSSVTVNIGRILS